MRLNVAVAILAFLHSTSAQECVSGTFTIEFEGFCNYDNILAAYTKDVFEVTGAASDSCGAGATAAEDLQAKLNAAGTTIDEVCKGAHDRADITPFYEAAREGEDMHFEQQFYNGRSYWQEEVETLYESEDGTFTSRLKEDAKTIDEFYDADGRYGRVQWPNMLTNFADDTCTTNTAMCCWPKDRQANDNNGNCNKPYDINCVDKDPADNTDLCYNNYGKGNASNEFSLGEGYGVFPGGNNDGEGPIHCHGFAWANDEYDPISRYKANNLFYVSMYDHMYVRGYVEEIPGAPMCACLDQMPIVSRSDCTQVNLEEAFTLSFDGTDFHATIIKSEITYQACQGADNRNNDLWAYAKRLYLEGRMTNEQFGRVGRIITDNGCEVATEYEHQKLGLTKGYLHDESMWTKVAGRDSLYEEHEWGKEAFNAALFEHGTEQILLRVCATCIETHQYIYYKRLTDIIDPDFNLLDNLIYRNNNGNGDNVWTEDFTLHSTYEDAVSGANPWQCPNDFYNYGAYFPGDCSPDGTSVGGQESRFYSGGKRDVAWYVNKAEDYAISTFDSAAHTRSSLQTDLDIGNPEKPGRTFDGDGTIYMTAATKDISGKQDQFRYLSHEASGDIQVDVKVASFKPKTSDWAKAGIMLRNDNEDDSQYAFAMLTGGKGVDFQLRRSKGMSATSAGNEDSSIQDEAYLRLIKKMDTIEMWKSSDGINYVFHASAIVLFPDDTFRVGLAVTSNNWGNSYVEAAFEDFSVTTYEFPTAAPSLSSAPTVWEPMKDIGEPVRAGEIFEPDANGIVQMRAAGAGIWGMSDSFSYYSMQKPISEDFTVSMIIHDIGNGYQMSRGGLMIRENLEEDSPNMFIGLSGWNQGVTFQGRTSAGAETELYLQQFVPSKMVEVKLVKSGSDVTASFKHVDDAEWTVAGTKTLTLTDDSIQVGVANTLAENSNKWSYQTLKYSAYTVV